MIRINTKEVFNLIESTFELLLVVDSNEKVIHASHLLHKEFNEDDGAFIGRQLSDVATEKSYEQIKNVMGETKLGQRDSVLFTTDNTRTIALKARYTDSKGGLYLFFGTMIDELEHISELDKAERTKELACVYSIFEWIESSKSVPEFFTELPNYLARGMQYPEYAVVFSVYQGVKYGQKIPTGKYLKVDLGVNQSNHGEIQVGYISDEYDFLPEEQKMLEQIAGMLNLAIERKEYSQTLEKMRLEKSEYDSKIDNLKGEIDDRTEELGSQKQKLSTVNSYFDKISKDWEESKIRLETMFDAIPDEVAIIDLKRNVIMTNRKKVPPGKKCYATFFNSQKPCNDCRLSRIIKDKTPITLEIRRGDEYFEVHALPIFNSERQVEGIIEFYRNTTKEKLYEQQLQQADKLASLGQLVSGIGHEINNPNQFIQGNVKIIEQAFEDILPILDDYYKEHQDLKIARLKYSFFREHIMTLIKDMSHGSYRIKSIVDGLRKFARRDEGEHIDTVDINTIIDESTRLVHNQIHKKAEIELNLAHELPEFTGNSQKIEQVIINLLINASQAMPDGRKGIIEVTTKQENGNVVIVVKDNAAGMGKSTLKHIFDPFFTTKRAKGGTGLGLSIAYRIIEEHNGTISVSSKIGKGSIFTIKIPVSDEKTKSTE